MYATGKRAIGLCDVCGLKYPLSQLRYTIVNNIRTGIKACRYCWVPDHPQNMAGRVPVTDFQALRDPRPETYPADLRNIAWGWNPVWSFQAQAQLGQATIVIGNTVATPSVPAPTIVIPPATPDWATAADYLHAFLFGVMNAPGYF